MKAGNILMVVALAALFITAGVLLVVGISTHTEAGFMPGVPAWDHVPLTVYAVDQEEDVAGAVEDLNQRLGFPMFVMSQDGGGADVVVLPGSVPPEGAQPGGDTRHLTSGRHWARVRTWNNGTLQCEAHALRHELGHVMGLAHDDFDSSLMAERSDCPWPPARLTDHDRDLIRGRYHD